MAAEQKTEEAGLEGGGVDGQRREVVAGRYWQSGRCPAWQEMPSLRSCAPCIGSRLQVGT